tara:strand:- start:516 stop:848 length:333 start_codon:yes stop_codon:yes gene_type:complete
MSQYTDKINKIAQDFAEIEYYEKVSALEARDGMMIMHYYHGGKQITFHRDSEYEGTVGKAGDVITLPPFDADYIRLKEKYDSGESWSQTIARWWKKFKKMDYNPRGIFRD